MKPGLVGAVVALFCCAAAGAQGATLFGETSFTLKNGLQVVVVPNHSAPTVTQWVWYKVGAADELRGQSGAAHFLEHLMFRGTRTMKPKEFSEIVARQGGEENAFTSWDYTAFHQAVAADRLELVMRLEADRMQNLVITEDQLRPERDVVLEEWRMRIGNDPAALLDEQVEAALYLNHPYRIPVLGWVDEIKALDVPQEQHFYDTWYAPNNAVLIVAGDVTPAQVESLAERYYGPIPAKPVPERVRPQEPERSADVEVRLADPRVRQPQWSRYYLAPSYRTAGDDRPYAMQVLADVLGGGPSSRLHRALVLKQALATDAGAWYDASRYDQGQFGFYASARPGVTLDQLGPAAAQVAEAMLKDGITADEVDRAKSRLINSELYAQDSLGQPVEMIGRALCTGQTLAQLDDWPAKIAAVTVGEVNAAAHELLEHKTSVTGLLLPAAGGSQEAQPFAMPSGEFRSSELLRRAALLLALVLGAAAPARAMTIQDVVSPGGIHAWLVEDHARKVITLSFAVRGGAASDPADKQGLSLFAMSLLDEGAGPYDSGQYQGRLADLSAGVSFGADGDYLTGGLETLSPTRDEVFKLFRLALTEPRFDADAVERIRAELNQLIDNQQQDPNALAAQAFLAAEFAHHPYAAWASGTKPGVAAITAADLRGFVKTRLGRDRLLVSVVGDIGPTELKPLLDQTFGDLPAHALVPVTPADAVPAAAAEVVLVKRPLPQSVVRFGQTGIAVHDKDLYAAMVMNQVLGGGDFTSWLEAEVREKRGLAYGVGTRLVNRDHANFISGSIGTRNAKLAEALRIIREQWAKMRDQGPSEEEVADAKTYLNGSYTIGLDSSGAIAERLLGLQELGLGIDYFARRPGLIDAVTLDDVRHVARRLLDPDKLVFAVVGDPTGIKPAAILDSVP